MANWNNPLLTSLYIDFLNELKARDTDVVTMNPGSNFPVDSKRWNSSVNTFQTWNGSAWVNLVISAAGGGTGITGGLPALGTMATQNSNAVSITGGTISNVALDAGAITVGTLALARGGTGAPLSLGGAGSFLQSNGAQVIFGVNGGSLTGLNAGAITGGRLPIGNMPTGGDWDISPVGWFRVGGAIIAGAGLSNMGNGTINATAYFINNVAFTPGGGGTPIPTGMMAYFASACPSGWTFVAGSQARTVRSFSGGAGAHGGAEVHGHNFGVPAGGGGSTNSGPAQGEQSGGAIANITNRSFDAGSSFSGGLMNDNFTHSHTIGHTHQFDVPGFPGHNGTTGDASSWPSYIEFMLCRKD